MGEMNKMKRIRLTRNLVPFLDGPTYKAGSEGELIAIVEGIHYLNLEWKSLWKEVRPKSALTEEALRYDTYFEGEAKVDQQVVFHSGLDRSHPGLVKKVHEDGRADIEFSGIAKHVQVNGNDCYEVIK